MAITKTAIKNFTVFEDIEIDFVKGINVFVGENGTGKTHLLKILYGNNSFPPLEAVPNERGDIAAISVDRDGLVEDDKVFIPAKEILSMSNLTRIHERYSRDLAVDETLIDIIKKAQKLLVNNLPELAKKIASEIENIIDGKIFVKPTDLTFWVQKNNGLEIPFSMEAEGYRKFGLLWQLIMNESISQNTVLFWDEPEANINPKLIPTLVEIVLELSRNGVQIFIATHDYFLPKYIEVLAKETDIVAFHSLYKTDSGVKCETSDRFTMLENNDIINELISLYEKSSAKVTGL